MKQADIDNLKVGDSIGRVYNCPYTGFNSEIYKIIRKTKTRFIFKNKNFYLKNHLTWDRYKTEKDYYIATERRDLSLQVRAMAAYDHMSIEMLKHALEILKGE